MKETVFSFALVLTFLLTGISQTSAEMDPRLSSFQQPVFKKSPVFSQPHNSSPDCRQGGEDMASAVVFSSLPFEDSGNTCDNIDDYDFQCPTQSGGPDVVYAFTPSMNLAVTIDLCLSTFDTVIGVFENEMNMIACNDDANYDENDPCGQYTSRL